MVDYLALGVSWNPKILRDVSHVSKFCLFGHDTKQLKLAVLCRHKKDLPKLVIIYLTAHVSFFVRNVELLRICSYLTFRVNMNLSQIESLCEDWLFFAFTFIFLQATICYAQCLGFIFSSKYLIQHLINVASYDLNLNIILVK